MAVRGQNWAAYWLGSIVAPMTRGRSFERGAASAASTLRTLSTLTPSQPIACASSAMSVESILVPQLG